MAELLSLNSKQRRYLQNKKGQENEQRFIELVESGNTKEVAECLETGELDVNVKIKIGKLQMTPLLSAAEKNNFQMIQLLLDNGAERLKEPQLMTETGHFKSITDGAQNLQMYRSLSSPAYICLTSEDPLLTAMRMSERLHDLAHTSGIGSIYRDDFRAMSEQLEDFTVNVLEQCDDNDEVLKILHGPGKSAAVSWKRGDWVLAREAIDNHLKKFICHPYCQHVLHSTWLNGQPSWSEKPGIMWTVLYFAFCLLVYGVLQPILALIYICAPCSPLSKMIKSPKTRFLMYLWSYCMFMIFVVLAEMYNECNEVTINYSDMRCYLPRILVNKIRFDFLEIMIIILAIGLLWGECQQAMTSGVKAYILDFWNVMDNVVVLFFPINIIISTLDYDQHMSYKSVIIITMMPAFFVTIACIRLMQYFYLHRALGSMLLSFTRMRMDVFYFLILFGVVVLSFTFGFVYMYSGNNNFYAEEATNNTFSSISSSFSTLIFAIFGKEVSDELKVSYKIRTTDFELYEFYSYGDGNWTWNFVDRVDDYGYINSTMGFVLYALFLLANLMLVNLCIAMMSDTYAKLQENIDIEWKFIRTSLWIQYIRGPVLPSPFNIIPNYICVKGIIKRWKGRSVMVQRDKIHEVDQEDIPIDDEPGEAMDELSYKELVRILTSKYMEESMNGGSDGDEEDKEEATPTINEGEEESKL
ncbi:short transient receptor potential channel 3-like [Glandiceps talaboti]